MTEEEIEIVARAMADWDGQPWDKCPENARNRWRSLASAALAALDKHREGREEADWPRRDFISKAACIFPFDMEKSAEAARRAAEIWDARQASPIPREEK